MPVETQNDLADLNYQEMFALMTNDQMFQPRLFYGSTQVANNFAWMMNGFANPGESHQSTNQGVGGPSYIP